MHSIALSHLVDIIIWVVTQNTAGRKALSVLCLLDSNRCRQRSLENAELLETSKSASASMAVKSTVSACSYINVRWEAAYEEQPAKQTSAAQSFSDDDKNNSAQCITIRYRHSRYCRRHYSLRHCYFSYNNSAHPSTDRPGDVSNKDDRSWPALLALQLQTLLTKSAVILVRLSTCCC